MTATHILLGEPDWVGMLVYAVIFFGTLAGFVLVVRLIYVSVFRRKETITTIGRDSREGGSFDERG